VAASLENPKTEATIIFALHQATPSDLIIRSLNRHSRQTAQRADLPQRTPKKRPNSR